MNGPTLASFFESWDLFREPVLTGIAAGLLLGYLGVFIVLRRMVFVAATLSQAAAFGVALTFLAELHGLVDHASEHPVVGALVFALLTMVLFTGSTERFRITREGLLGLGYLTGASGALLVGAKTAEGLHDVQAVLFGVGVAVTTEDYHLNAGAALVLLPLHAWMIRGLLFASFDPESARVQRVPVRALDVFLFLSIGVAVAVATHAIGAISSFAFSVLPAMAALALSGRTRVVLLASPLIGAFAAGAGYLLAYVYELPVGATQTFLACAMAGLAIAGAMLLRKSV